MTSERNQTKVPSRFLSINIVDFDKEETKVSKENPQARLRPSETQPMYNDCGGGKRD